LTFKKIPKQIIILGLISLFTDIASEMLYPVTPIFLTAFLGASMAVVGLIEGIAEFTSGLLKGIFGKVSDKIGKRSNFVVIGYSLSALVKPFPGILPFVPTVVFSRITDRIGKGIRTAPRDALLASYATGNTGAIFGFHRGMDTLGAAIGPICALILLHFYSNDFRLVFLTAFIPSIAAIGLTFIIRERKILVTEKKKYSNSILWKNSSFQFKSLIVLVTIFSLVNSSDAFLILKSQSVLHSSTLAIFGYVCYNLVYSFTSYPMGKLADRFSKKNIYILGLFIFSIVYFGFAVTTNFNFIWGFFMLYGIFAASTEGVTKAWVSDLIPNKDRGTAIGLMTMFSSIAIMFGSFMTGLLWDMFGPTFPFMISCCVSALTALAFLFIKENNE
jgi:MFS family permease